MTLMVDFRIYCRKYSNGSIKLPYENVNKMMKTFVKRVKMNKKIMINFINKKNKAGKKIYLYGASTKGNTLLQYYGITSKLIPFAAERSPDKWKKYTIGTGIEIISEKNIIHKVSSFKKIVSNPLQICISLKELSNSCRTEKFKLQSNSCFK